MKKQPNDKRRQLEIARYKAQIWTLERKAESQRKIKSQETKQQESRKPSTIKQSKYFEAKSVSTDLDAESKLIYNKDIGLAHISILNKTIKELKEQIDSLNNSIKIIEERLEQVTEEENKK